MLRRTLFNTTLSAILVTMLAIAAIGQDNTFLGLDAGLSNTTGTDNSFFGASAGKFNTTGIRNTFVGGRAGDTNGTGSNNVFVGFATGFANVSGSNNTVVGVNARLDVTNMNYATAIGAGAFVANSNSVVLGRNVDTVRVPGGLSVSGTSYLTGPFIVDTATSYFLGTIALSSLGSGGSSSLCRNSSNKISTCSSSLRYKTNFASFGAGLDLIKRLRPITFDWKEDGMHDLGLGAEDVAAIEPLLVTYNVDGSVEGVKYDRIGVVLINAIKEQQKMIESQRSELNALKALVCATNTKAAVCRGM